jgi:hypothetical protein
MDVFGEGGKGRHERFVLSVRILVGHLICRRSELEIIIPYYIVLTSAIPKVSRDFFENERDNINVVSYPSPNI